ncbi:restriction endonuclease [Paenibacillus gansuensis]|uniref:Restriction endonuclease n=1 Tax=Paenibacillus gansuensis TaxID=306542 RepID=A0ABW5PEE8_9BACL
MELIGGGAALLLVMGLADTKYFQLSLVIFLLFVAIVVGILYAIKQRKIERLRRSGIADIDKMDGHRFEHYLAQLFKFHGYRSEVTKASGDYGADLVISKDGRKIVVQAKRYSAKVGIKAVQEAFAAIAHYGAAEAWVVTNNDYTDAAYALAKSNKVRLINREALIELMLAMNTAKPANKQETATQQ